MFLSCSYGFCSGCGDSSLNDGRFVLAVPVDFCGLAIAGTAAVARVSVVLRKGAEPCSRNGGVSQY